MQESEVVIVEVTMPAAKVVLFQSLLHGEDGLAVMRCFDPGGQVQQLWTTPAQHDDLLDWLLGLPVELGVQVLGEQMWEETVYA